MKRPCSAVLFILCCLPAAPLFAQTEIGGGACTSSTVSGVYAFTMAGREITSAGNVTNVLQANGSATFDGLSKVTIAMTTDSIQSVGTPLSWSGTYTMQSNCYGVVTITSGGSATLNIALYDTGADFLVTGNDSIYSYSGSGNTQPSGCSATTFSGVYSFTGTGYSLSNGSVNGVANATGLLKFDGVSNLTANLTLSETGTTTATDTATGSYSVSSTCVASATIADTSGNSFTMTFSVTSTTDESDSGFYATFAHSAKTLISGSGHPVFGQPTATAANQGAGGKPAPELLAQQLSETFSRRGR
jgi:hypothetical protein